MDFNLDAAHIQYALLNLLIAVISFTVHEWGHAKMADHLGDDTPRSQGRVSLNPLVHIDLLGTIIVPLLAAFGVFGGLGFIGWAKPVYTDPRNFKNRNTDEALVTIAGPAMNVALALLATLLAVVAHRLLPSSIALFDRVAELNVLLVVFNLLPIPPLDGSKFLMYWFGMSEEAYFRFAQWGGILLLVLINFQRVQAILGFLVAAGMVPFRILFHVLTA